ncbi:MAG TPA: large conductance mechanosensitive channel protein MscL [Actinobacteria bacterium]|jgi:large conductance mechanosensitive channel|nr:large conductance mechanosensitive channel protein MscL [Actinomycetota bacterium]
MIKGFRDFILRGNVVDLAVAFVAGAAFTTLIGAFSAALIQPIIAIFLGGGINAGTLEINGQVIDFTALINAIIMFLITMLVLYLIFVAPMNAYRKRTAEPVPDPAPQTDVEILAEIRDLLRAQRAGE